VYNNKQIKNCLGYITFLFVSVFFYIILEVQITVVKPFASIHV